MPQYNLTNHWIEFRYSVTNQTHVQKFQVDSAITTPQASAVNVTLNTKGGGTIPFLDFIADYTLAIAPLFSTPEASFDSMTLWHQPNGATEPIFITADSAGIIWNQPTSVASPAYGGQVTTTYRATNGKLLKLVFMETWLAPHARSDIPSAPAGVPALGTYVLSNDCPIQARSGAYAMLAMNYTNVYNDKVVRKRFLVD